MGGVSIYFRNVIPFINRVDLTPDTTEATCLEIKKSKSEPLLISTWYRPPGSTMEFFNEFETFLKMIDNENKEILVVTGDFNCDLLKIVIAEISSNLRALTKLSKLLVVKWACPWILLSFLSNNILYHRSLLSHNPEFQLQSFYRAIKSCFINYIERLHV